MLELWLIRHGQTDWNAEGRIQGQTNSQLTDLGKRQAQKLAERIEHESFDAIYSSDSDRARDTARTVYPKENIIFDKRLRERHFGTFEGKVRAEFTTEELELYNHVREDPVNRTLPNGETWTDMRVRVSAWMAELPSEGRAIAFSHGGAIRAALHSILDFPQHYEWNILFTNTGITRLHLYQTQKVIVTVNDSAHLEALNE